MNLSQAIEHASTLFVPEFLFGFDEANLNAERENNEQAIKCLHEEWFASENPGFSYDLVRELADRNRALCDNMDAIALENIRGLNLSRGLSENDVLRGIAALQHRKPETIQKEIMRANSTLGVAYASKQVKGTILGIDIETTSREPDGSFNEEYCKWCYVDGSFFHTSLEELTDFLVEHMSKEGWPTDQARAYFQEQLPKLNHWKHQA